MIGRFNIMKIFDFSKCQRNKRDGQYGGVVGNKAGVFINGENWIIKYPKNTKGMQNVDDLSYTTSPLSEYIGSQVYELLNYMDLCICMAINITILDIISI